MELYLPYLGVKFEEWDRCYLGGPPLQLHLSRSLRLAHSHVSPRLPIPNTSLTHLILTEARCGSLGKSVYIIPTKALYKDIPISSASLVGLTSARSQACQSSPAPRLLPQAIKGSTSNVIAAVPRARCLSAPPFRLIARVPSCAIVQSFSLVETIKARFGDPSNDIGSTRVQK